MNVGVCGTQTSFLTLRQENVNQPLSVVSEKDVEKYQPLNHVTPLVLFPPSH